MTIQKLQKMRLQLLNAQAKMSKYIIDLSNLEKEIEVERANGTLTKLKEESYKTEKRFLESMLIATDKMHKYLNDQESMLTSSKE